MPYKDLEKRKECQKRYYQRNKDSFKNRHSKRKKYLRNFVNKIKAEKGCFICQEKRYQCLDFHHTNPSDKKFGIAKGVNHYMYGKKELKKEIDKCIVLCANCHRVEHYK